MQEFTEEPGELEYDDVFPFGQYKGELVGDIVQKDPVYIRWVMENTEWYFDEEILELIN